MKKGGAPHRERRPFSFMLRLGTTIGDEKARADTGHPPPSPLCRLLAHPFETWPAVAQRVARMSGSGFHAMTPYSASHRGFSRLHVRFVNDQNEG
jgi:hypothetical protein